MSNLTTKCKQYKGPNHILAPKSTCPIDMFSNENYLGQPQDTELKRTTINFIKELNEFKCWLWDIS